MMRLRLSALCVAPCRISGNTKPLSTGSAAISSRIFCNGSMMGIITFSFFLLFDSEKGMKMGDCVILFVILYFVWLWL